MKIKLIVLLAISLAGCSLSSVDSRSAENVAVLPVPTPTVEKAESGEEKAAKLAEEFIARNGYTDAEPDRERIAYESVEFAASVDELLASRRGTLEPKAFDVRRGSQGSRGWAVVFRYRQKEADEKVGRAVTMDESFGNLRVEHKSIFLKRPGN